MKALRFIAALACLFTSLAATAQVKKIPVKKKPVIVNKTIVKRAVKKAPVAVTPPAPGIRIQLTTDSGVIVLRLYDSTPLHRDNFVKLVKEHFFDSLLFHRVIRGFMIQGGDPLSKNAQPGQPLGKGGGDLALVPAEFSPTIFHKKGALAAARMGDDVNPTRASSACQFYIVQGQKYTDDMLNMIEMQMGRKFSPSQRLVYKTIGGTPQLDMGYTVFGEVEKGLDVIDKIASVPTQPSNRPLGDVRMKMQLMQDGIPLPDKIF